MPHIRRVVALCLLVCAVLGSPSWAASTCTVTASQVDGRKQVRAVIVETGARDTTEVACVGVPVTGTIVSYEGTLTAGTGTAIHPLLGVVASFVVDAQGYLASAVATAARINEKDRTTYHSPTGTLYVRSNPNSTATDHAIDSEILIVEGAL